VVKRAPRIGPDWASCPQLGRRHRE
jgi:hypothetical protein